MIQSKELRKKIPFHNVVKLLLDLILQKNIYRKACPKKRKATHEILCLGEHLVKDLGFEKNGDPL